MNTNIPKDGFNLSMEIVNKYPPKYWQNTEYGNQQYIIKFVDYYSYEFYEIMKEIYNAQLRYGVQYTNNVSEIHRIQNPYTYSRFVLRKKQMHLQTNNYVYQKRMYKLIPKEFINTALKYNCDGRRLGKPDSDHVFHACIPNAWYTNALLTFQVLTSEDNEDRDIGCLRDSEFYIEYVVFFNH